MQSVPFHNLKLISFDLQMSLKSQHMVQFAEVLIILQRGTQKYTAPLITFIPRVISLSYFIIPTHAQQSRAPSFIAPHSMGLSTSSAIQYLP
jgi:hypothetical protein